MKKNSVKKVMFIIVLFTMLCVVSTVNYATGDINAILQNIIQIDTTEQPTQQQPKQEENTVQNIVTLPTTNTTNLSNTNTNTNTNKELPKTGVDDTMLWVLIAVSVVAAGYTYKKVRDYNV